LFELSGIFLEGRRQVDNTPKICGFWPSWEKLIASQLWGIRGHSSRKILNFGSLKRHFLHCGGIWRKLLDIKSHFLNHESKTALWKPSWYLNLENAKASSYQGYTNGLAFLQGKTALLYRFISAFCANWQHELRNSPIRTLIIFTIFNTCTLLEFCFKVEREQLLLRERLRV
jgi:hypothetical protein